VRPGAGPLLAAAVLAVSAMLNVSAGREKSVTFDEVAHLTGGYSYWTLNDYRLHGENGNLPQRLEALPLLASRLSFPSRDQDSWWHSYLLRVGRQFFFECGNDADTMVARGRYVVVLLAVGLGALVYAWSHRLFGPPGGLVSVVLYAFCPTVLAHGGLATSDLAVSLFFTAALWSGWTAWHHLSPATLLLSGLALAGLFLSKMSAFVILPTGVLLAGVRVAAGRPLDVAWPGGGRQVRGRLSLAGVLLLTTCLQAIVVAVAIWAAFGFRFDAMRDARPGRDVLPLPQCWEQPGLVADCLRFAREQRLLPEGYLQGFASTLLSARERPAFFNGEFGTEGWLLFFPYCVAVKTPLSLFALAALAVAGVFRSRQLGGPGVRSLLYDTAPLTVFLAVYWAFALASHLNIGQRHLLPTYPAVFVLTGAAAVWLRQPARVPRLLVAGLLAAFVGESLLTWPNYLSYFNVLAGGSRNGYRHLVDSSLDWGQDLPGLNKWLQQKGLGGRTRTPVYLSYFGTALPQYYGVQAIPLPSFLEFSPHAIAPLRGGGVYCVSATMLHGVVGGFRCPGPWTDEYESRYRFLARVLDPAATRDELIRWTKEVGPGNFIGEYEQLRFGRLCAFLRQREPDDEVGYSILIYRLTDEEVRRAESPETPAPVHH
jgi:4-amino-4-deoxy-L-arabinose transferase-like glycosyltransferase